MEFNRDYTGEKYREIARAMGVEGVDDMEWADDIAVVHRGQVIAFGEPAKVFSDTELLRKTNLRKPAAIELFESLTAKGVLPAGLAVPANLSILEEYISNI